MCFGKKGIGLIGRMGSSPRTLGWRIDGTAGPGGLIFLPPLTSRLQSKIQALTLGVKDVFLRVGASRSKQLSCLSAVTMGSIWGNF